MTLQEALLQYIKNNPAIFGKAIGSAGGSTLGNQPQVLAEKVRSIVTKTWAEISPPINGMHVDIDVDTTMSDGNVIVNVRYDHEMALRDSFSPNSFLGGIDFGDSSWSGRADLLILLNNGWEYDAAKRPYGIWHGARVPALNQRDGIQFMQATETALKEALGKGVQVELNAVYK